MRVPIRDAATAQQINTLLSVFSVTATALASVTRLELDMENNDEDPDLVASITSEARTAVENTLIRCLGRIDKVLDDESRWSMKHQDRIESDRQELVDAQLKLQKAQAALATEMTMPHFRYRPHVCRALDGDWVAFIGDPNDLNNAIVGAGKTPQAAIDDFDKKFGEPMPQLVTDWLDKYEQQLNDGVQPDPFPTLTQNEVDTRASEPAGADEAPRDDRQADSGEDGTGLPAGDR